MPGGVPEITALRPAGASRTAVELDGRAWRVLPDACIVEAGIAVGRPLTRGVARSLARSRRRQRALEAALRVLGRRAHTSVELTRRLADRGVGKPARDEALTRLAETGLVDDRSFAVGRAAALAARGLGDLAIAADLRGRGVGSDDVARALETAEPEAERARRLVAERGLSPRTLGLLSRRGFGEATLEPLAEALAEAGATD